LTGKSRFSVVTVESGEKKEIGMARNRFNPEQIIDVLRDICLTKRFSKGSGGQLAVSASFMARWGRIDISI
jgi:hypothetical protein